MAVTNLKMLILQSGLKLYQLADHLEINRGQFSLIANGRLVPTPQQRLRIEQTLGQSADKLLAPFQLPKAPARERLRRRAK